MSKGIKEVSLINSSYQVRGNQRDLAGTKLVNSVSRTSSSSLLLIIPALVHRRHQRREKAVESGKCKRRKFE
ncbi:hypothetical protein TWF970_003022 [Orbilia oligospora]|uniref:Uncharacterized protein n=1 Tax=Orbilia oligospora TaxID=2813651 RepID=A0A7C8R970_ORBOL|nr:hypothetical protein TWF970_003022 [Orbilia oligospora]